MKSQAEMTLYVFLGVCLVLCIGMFVIIRKYLRALKLTRRLENYTIEPLIKHESSFGESVYRFGLDFLEKFSRWLNHFQVFQSYSQKYEVYKTSVEEDPDSLIEFVAKKFLWSLLFLGIYFFLCGIRQNTPSILWTVFFFSLGFFIPDFYWEAERRKRNNQIEEDLLKAITIMSNSFKAGKSIVQALNIVAEELPGPLGDEFYKMHVDLNFGLELEMVLERFYTRVPLEDIRYITTSLIVLNRTGGNISKIFESIETNFLDRQKIKKELVATTASASVIFKVLAILPFVLIVLIRLMNPSYFEVFFRTTVGMLFLLIITVLYVIYIVVIHHIMRIDY